MTEIHPEDFINDLEIKQLVINFEAILTEMRTHARANRTIAEWVNRLDFARDEFTRYKFPVVAEKNDIENETRRT
jgi:pyridoxal/pyridoxine/pyridoxamine kinase